MAHGWGSSLWSTSGINVLAHAPSMWPVALVTALLAVSISDILWRRVANKLVATLWLSGLCLSLQGGGFLGLEGSLMASVICFAIAFLPYGLGLMGAADVKTFAGLGALVGPAGILPLVVYAAIFAGLMGAVALSSHASYSLPRMAIACLHPQGALERARNKGQTMPLTVAFCSSVYIVLWGKL